MTDEHAVLVIDQIGLSLPLPRSGEITIGRDPSNDVVINSPTVSRHHARLRPTGEGWLLTDGGSSNGTFIDGRILTGGQTGAVGIGTQVSFGDVAGQIRSTAPPAPPPHVGAPTDPRVFVSYSHHDAHEVDRLVSDLQRRGIAVWLDRAGLVGGADWTTEIVSAIRDADAFIVVLSRWSINSDDVANEVHLAGEGKVPVLPVLIDAVHIPESLAYHLAGRQRYDLTGDNRAFEVDRLIRAIRSPRVRQHRQRSRLLRIVAAALIVAVLVGTPTTVLSVLTGSFPPDVGRITGSRTCDGLEMTLATENITTFVETKTAHLAVVFANASSTDIDMSGWSVDLTSGGGSGEPYRFIENEGVEDLTLEPGGRTTGRVAVRGSLAPSEGDEPVRLEVSGLEQGDSVFAKCSATTQGTIRWG